jgi:cytochrome b subunit of formate dehydrogenase
VNGPTYVRFTRDQRLEHLVLVVTFVVLAVTGLPQKFASTRWAEGLIALLGGIESARIIHRAAAVLLMVQTVYHAAAVAYRVLVRGTALSMMPAAKDVRDAWQTLLYNVGRSPERPQMARFTFEEKVEYLSLLWGTVLMILTGFMLWNPIATAWLLPGEFIPAAKAAHGGEALLAVLAIIVWHGYGVHLRHFNRSMWTGTMTEAEMREEHPLELKAMQQGTAERPVEEATAARRQRVFFPVAVALSAMLIAGIVWFVTFEQTAIETVTPPR